MLMDDYMQQEIDMLGEHFNDSYSLESCKNLITIFNDCEEKN